MNRATHAAAQPLRRATTSTLAVAIACGVGQGVAASPDETARVLAGLVPAPGFEAHARAVSERWDDYERRIGRPMREWARAELGTAAGATVFYPFSGPDLPTVAQLHPEADRFVLVAAQPARAPPGRLAPESLGAFRRAWERYARSGFFNTKDLDRDGGGLGPAGLLMAFAARLGYEIVAVEPVRLAAGGADLALHPGDRAKPATWDSVRFALARDGRAVRLDYVRLDLADANLAADRAARAWVERMAANPTVIKAASHLPQRPRFAILREAILAHSPSVWQDETGIDYALLAGAFSVQLYGDFSRPNRLFAPGSQAALAAAYRRGEVQPLPFRVGYEKHAGSTVQVAVRDPRFLEARLAERLARYERRPRKLFVSGRDGDDYVTALKAQVAKAAAPIAARRDSGRAALVTLTLAPDGSLRELDLDRSSGDAAFDRGVRESVRASGPFPPLPEAIRSRADLLVVTLQLPER